MLTSQKSSLFKQLLENDITKTIFDNIRNFLYCAFFLAMGTQAAVNPGSTIGFSETGIRVSGILLIGISILLMLLNALDGAHKLSKLGIHAVVYPFIIFAYFIVVGRLVMFAWGYRLA